MSGSDTKLNFNQTQPDVFIHWGRVQGTPPHHTLQIGGKKAPLKWPLVQPMGIVLLIANGNPLCRPPFWKTLSGNQSCSFNCKWWPLWRLPFSRQNRIQRREVSRISPWHLQGSILNATLVTASVLSEEPVDTNSEYPHYSVWKRWQYFSSKAIKCTVEKDHAIKWPMPRSIAGKGVLVLNVYILSSILSIMCKRAGLTLRHTTKELVSTWHRMCRHPPHNRFLWPLFCRCIQIHIITHFYLHPYTYMHVHSIWGVSRKTL